MPKPPLVTFPGIGHPTCYSVNDLALGSPAAEVEHLWGFISPLFLSFSLIVDQQCPSSSLSLHCYSLPYPHPPGFSFVLRPRVCLGPGESYLTCFGCSSLSPVPSHTYPLAQKHTHTCGQDALHCFKPCKDISISYRKGPNSKIFNILE